jgi:hypothetical protein
MNDASLSVTINAAKSDYPLSAAPVSIVTRDIITICRQYQRNNCHCKQKNVCFKSFLVASAADNKR